MRPIATVAALVVLIVTLTGCNTAMSAQSSASDTVPGKPVMDTATRTINGNLLPLRFNKHNFEANCYNTQRCFVIYDGSGFLHKYKDVPAPAPPDSNYQKHWGLASYLGVPNSTAPAKVTWTSLDGVDHEAMINMREIFKDQIALHNVPDDQIPDGMFKQGWITEPSVYLEINDRTLSIYMKAFVPTKSEQIAGNRYSKARTDLILAWSKAY
jgi:hypothetical protein